MKLSRAFIFLPGWLQASTASGISYLTYTGSNTLNIANVYIYGDPISTIIFSATNGGGEQVPNQISMVANVSEYLLQKTADGEIICPANVNYNVDNHYIHLSRSTQRHVSLLEDPDMYCSSGNSDNDDDKSSVNDILIGVLVPICALVVGSVIYYFFRSEVPGEKMVNQLLQAKHV